MICASGMIASFNTFVFPSSGMSTYATYIPAETGRLDWFSMSQRISWVRSFLGSVRTRVPASVKMRIVAFGGEPSPIPDETIASLRILVERGEGVARPHPLVRDGQRVVVVDGSFRGAVGVLHVTAGRKPQLIVEVEFLGRAVAVPIAPEQVHPLT